MQVIACQFNMIWHDKPANHVKVNDLLEQIEIQPGALLVVPEMFDTGYSMSVADTRDDLSGRTASFLTQLARNYQAYLVGGIVGVDRSGKGLNQALVAGPTGEAIARYTKMHPTSFLGETDHYAAGDDVVVVECGGARIAPFICYDLRFPEIFRASARKGAEVLIVIASWPAARHEHWLTLLRARAIENQAYVIGVNRCGTDPNHMYAGGSQIIDPSGRILADAEDRETALACQLDLQYLRDYRTQLPFLNDMRQDQAMSD